MTKVNNIGDVRANSAQQFPTPNGGNENLEAAIEAARLGYSVISVNPKTKRANASWTPAQTQRATPDELSKKVNLQSYAIVSGAVSGGTNADGAQLYLVVLDFDVDGFFERWRAATGDLSNGLPVQRTGGGGYQVVFKSPAEIRNVGLAYSPNEALKAGREIAIETRGEGGYFLAPPSLHPSGNRYQWIEGDLSTVPTISAEHAEALLGAARSLDEAPLTRQQLDALARAAKPLKRRADASGVSVIDAYNASHEIGDTLERYGYQRKGDRFARPDGTSPSVVILDGRSFHHSSNDALHDEKHTQDPFSIYCCFEHGNEIKAAVKAAAGELGLTSAYQSATRGETVEAPDDDDTRVVINASIADARYFAPLCWDALLKASKTPRLFKIGAGIVRLESGDGKPQLRDLDEPRLTFELARAAIFTKTKKRGEEEVVVVVHTPREFVRDLLADDRPPLPRLTRIVEAPVFSSNGELQTQPGYHEKSQTFFHAARGLIVPNVSDDPTPDEMTKARGLIFRPLADFPFVSQADRANAIGFALTAFARDMIDGATPLGGIEANEAGTGKGLLADVILAPSIGRNAGTLTLGKDENDTKNRLTAVFQSGKAAVLLDNVNAKIDSGALASALTSLEWEDRKFITHEIRSYPVRCVWLMTANNPTMSTEIARRYVRIRLNAKCENPWQRDGFKIGDLRGWMKENRADIIWAYLTLIRAWQRAGSKRSNVRLGSYEEWAGIIGGVLENAGIEGFLTNLQELYNDADSEGAMWRAFVQAWYAAHGSEKVTTAALFECAQSVDGLIGDKKTESAEKKSLGIRLKSKRDTVIGGFVISAAGTNRNGVSVWQLRNLDKSAGSAGSCGELNGNYARRKSSSTLENPTETQKRDIALNSPQLPALPALPALCENPASGKTEEF